MGHSKLICAELQANKAALFEKMEKQNEALRSKSIQVETILRDREELEHILERREKEIDEIDAQLQRSFAREMELRQHSQFKRTIGMSPLTIKAYATPLPKMAPRSGGSPLSPGPGRAKATSPTSPSAFGPAAPGPGSPLGHASSPSALLSRSQSARSFNPGGDGI